MRDIKKEIHNVAIYTRVSTEDQAKEGYSLDAQKEKLTNYSKTYEYNIVDFYIDEGRTGRNTKRPEYQRMLTDINRWDAILVMKMDRIHRNQVNFLDMMEFLYQANKEFISMNEKLDTSTAMGRFVMQIIQGVAELESGMISERVKIAVYQKLETTNEFMGGSAPMGYRWEMGDKKAGIIGVMHIIPEELDRVKKAFELYLTGNYSNQNLADIVKIPASTMGYILANPIYAGYSIFGDQTVKYVRKVDYIKPILTIDQFNLTQKMKAKKSKRIKHGLVVGHTGVVLQDKYLTLTGEERQVLRVKAKLIKVTR